MTTTVGSCCDACRPLYHDHERGSSRLATVDTGRYSRSSGLRCRGSPPRNHHSNGQLTVSLKIKVDEDLPAVIAEMARRAGYDAATVLDQAMSGAKDPVPLAPPYKGGEKLLTDATLAVCEAGSAGPQDLGATHTRSGRTR